MFGPVKNSHPTTKILFENNDKQPYNEKKQEELMYDLIEWLIDDHQSFSVLKNQNFQEFMNNLNSKTYSKAVNF